MRNWWEHMPTSKPCEAADTSLGAFICPQGMAMEVDYHNSGGDLLDEPRVWYRCQDCGERIEVNR